MADEMVKALAVSHNSKTSDSEPAWSKVDKNALPDAAFADKKNRKYPHHWISGGKMYLHTGGLSSAIAAANGARSGQEASAECKSHLNLHKKASGSLELDSTLPEDVENAFAQNQGEVGSFEYFGLEEFSSASGEGDAGQSLAGAESGRPQPAGRVTATQGVRTMPELTKEDIRQTVASMLADKDAQAKVEARVGSLEAEKSTLSAELAKAKETIVSLQAAGKDHESAKAKFETDLKAAQDSAKAAQDQAKAAEDKAKASEQKLAAVEAEKALASRVEILTKAGTLMPKGEKQDKQLSRVKAMSDEQFTEYATELADVKGPAPAATTPAGTTPAVAATTPGAGDATPPAGEAKPPESAVASQTSGAEPPATGDVEAFRQTVAGLAHVGTIDGASVEAYAQM